MELYQTELLLPSHDQMSHLGMDKVYNRIQKRFECPGLKKVCEKWISACLSCQQAKDPSKLRFPLQSIELSGFNEVVQIDHQKICMTATGYNQVLIKIDHFTKYAAALSSNKVRDVIRRQQDLNDLCRMNTQEEQVRTKIRRFDKRAADAKAYSVGDYVWVVQEVNLPKVTKKLLKKWRGPFQITEVHQGVRFYRLSTG